MSSPFVKAESVRSKPEPKVFMARYDGSCLGCGEPIYEGDLIVYDNDDLIHEECAA